MALLPFKLNYKGMGEYLGSDEMLAMVTKKGEQALARARATAPDYEPIGVGYVDDFGMTVDKRATGHSKTPRACATVFNTSDHALEVEFGGRATPRHRTLGKAIGSVG